MERRRYGVAEIVSGVIRMGRKVEVRLEEQLRIYPCEACVGLIGVSGVKPRVYIENSHDRMRMLELVWERPFIRHVLEVLREKPDGNFLDIGAAEGAYTLLSAAVLERGKVVAIEPEPTICEKLKRNIRLNNFDVKVLEVAATNCEGTVFLNTSGAEGRAPGMSCAEKFDDTIKVTGMTVDALIRDKIIPTPDFVKIDVEGAEGLVLGGMKKLLSGESRPKHIFLETHSEEMLEEFGYKTEEILECLKNVGYVEVFNYSRHGQLLFHFSC